MVISICLAGIKILLLTVLLCRKRWAQMCEKFLLAFAASHFKYLCIIWYYYYLNEEGTSLCYFMILVLTIKSFKILIYCFRIRNRIIKDIRTTVFMILSSLIVVLIVPLTLLHVFLPCIFGLQLKKYTKYSKLDF